MAARPQGGGGMIIVVLALIAAVALYLEHLRRKFAKKIEIYAPLVGAVVIVFFVVTLLLLKWISAVTDTSGLVAAGRIVVFAAVIEVTVAIMKLVGRFRASVELHSWSKTHWVLLRWIVLNVWTVLCYCFRTVQDAVGGYRPIRYTTFDGAELPANDQDYMAFAVERAGVRWNVERWPSGEQIAARDASIASVNPPLSAAS
jgi:hypothetical protein